MTQPKIKTIIIGSNGNCRDILDTINDINDSNNENCYECIGFLDDNSDSHGTEINGVKVLGSLSSAINYNDTYFINGIGSPHNYFKKEEIIKKTHIPTHMFTSIIHPSASVSQTAKIGKDVVILQNVSICSNVTIRNHVIILPNSIISHDDVIGDYTSIAGGVAISGECIIGKSCYLGTHCSIRGGTHIGDYSIIGMSSTVLNDVAPESVIVGNPGRLLRTLNS